MALQLRAKFATRTRWQNHTGNQGVDPLQRHVPGQRRSKIDPLQELVEIAKDAEEHDCTVRAVGSGHSWSDVALTSGFLIDTRHLNRMLSTESDLLRVDPDAENLVRAEAGIRLRELNQELDRRDLALSNMGGFDAQTLAGVMSTSTHGSGIGFGPIADSVRSIDLVASRGKIYRIEPEDGPSDRPSYERTYPDRTLVQEDDYFHAAIVGMGCMGLIYAAIVAVEPEYRLTEVRSLSTWREVREDLRSGKVLRDNRHYEVLFNPYPRNGEHTCLITTRNKASPGSGESWRARHRNVGPEIAAALPFTGKFLDFVAGLRPDLTPSMLDRALALLEDEEYTEASYRVLNIGTANFLPAYSAEIGVPVDARERHIQAVEKIIGIADRHRDLGAIYHTSPISLRFVKGSPAFMSMMHGHDTMMIELIQATHTEGGFELLAEYEEALYALSGRPHWGQVNTLTGSHGMIEQMYPRYPEWQRVHQKLNASGVFDSPFSKRVGISRDEFTP